MVSPGLKQMRERNADQGGLYRVEHTLLRHKIALMREKDRSELGSFRHSSSRFRQITREISLIISTEITRDIPVGSYKPVIVAVLRAGIVMSDAMLEIMPSARVGHIGLHRNDREIVQYLVALPDSQDRDFIILDPVIGTGNVASTTIKIVKNHKVAESNIRYGTIVAAPEGLAKISQDHPGVRVYFADLADGLDEKLQVVPGWGDASERMFGLKNVGVV